MQITILEKKAFSLVGTWVKLRLFKNTGSLFSSCVYYFKNFLHTLGVQIDFRRSSVQGVMMRPSTLNKWGIAETGESLSWNAGKRGNEGPRRHRFSLRCNSQLPSAFRWRLCPDKSSASGMPILPLFNRTGLCAVSVTDHRDHMTAWALPLTACHPAAQEHRVGKS